MSLVFYVHLEWSYSCARMRSKTCLGKQKLGFKYTVIRLKNTHIHCVNLHPRYELHREL